MAGSGRARSGRAHARRSPGAARRERHAGPPGARGVKGRSGRTPPPARGFSLLEVVVAAGVVVTAILSLYAVMLGGARVQDTSHETEIATQAARSEVELLRDLPLATVLSTYGTRAYFPVKGDRGVALQPPAGVPGVMELEVCREDGASGSDLPSVKDAFGQDLDLNADGDRSDLPDATFRILPVVITLRWRSGASEVRTLVLKTVLVKRAEDGNG